MGYTHYWTWNTEPDDKKLWECLKDMFRVTEHLKDTLAGWDGNGYADFEPRGIAFNGKGGNAHETFCFPGETGFNFCKTAYKPYDLAVTTCLLIARSYFLPSELRIGSDGEIGTDWSDAIELFAALFPDRYLPQPILGE